MDVCDVVVVCCLQKKDGGWHEVLVDVNDADRLQFVLSPAETPASQLLLKVCYSPLTDRSYSSQDPFCSVTPISDRMLAT